VKNAYYLSRTFIATTNTHGCKNVINPQYAAGTTDAQGLLDSQKESVCTTSNKALETDHGRSLVQKYEISKDSQRIWESLQDYCTNSMVSIHRAQQEKCSFCRPAQPCTLISTRAVQFSTVLCATIATTVLCCS